MKEARLHKFRFMRNMRSRAFWIDKLARRRELHINAVNVVIPLHLSAERLR